MPDNFNMLEQLMGGAENSDPMAMMGRIQRLQKLMNSNQGDQNNEQSNQREKKNDISTPQENRYEQMLYTALPFIQQPFRNMIFNMTKFMEVQRIMSRKEEDVVLNAREKSGGLDGENNSHIDMLQAIKPFLSNNERQQIDTMVKFMNFGNVFNAFSQNNNANNEDSTGSEESEEIRKSSGKSGGNVDN